MDQRTSLFRGEDIPGSEALEELALDLRWSWNHRADEIWQKLYPSLWEQTHNPWVVLQSVSKERLRSQLADPAFRQLIDDLLETKRKECEIPAWFQTTYGQSPLKCIAYFSMEFMLTEGLPIYSGGLGNVAGDQLKAANDLGVPVIAIGLLYQQGYFRQVIDKNWDQQAIYPYNDPGQLPIQPLRKLDGEWLRLHIELPGWPVWVRAWEVIVGRVKLYLLDTNDPANFPIHRGITSELYGGDSELRLKQEILLGIGGWRLLDILGIKPEVCHLNEGHAAFAVLERAKSFMKENGTSFEVALTITRAGNLFTTHTAVPAGFDRFPPLLIEQYLEQYAKTQLGLSLEQLLALGRQNPKDPQEDFNMAYLAIRGSAAVNGVSKLHAAVSRRLFAPLFPKWPEEEVPVGYVTNGVHMPSWDSPMADDLWTEACGKGRWLGTTPNLQEKLKAVPDAKIWKMRNEARRTFVDYVRERVPRALQARGVEDEIIERSKHVFDPNTLTLGFARRFATYKRPNLLLHDPERLVKILNHAQYPVQLVLAGKAHPKDKAGQAMIHEWYNFIWRPDVLFRVLFLSDYDMLMTEHLVQSVDVWINTPRRPWEACGTSGMKVLVNGGVNLSELDGWWAEAYKPELGWALGDVQEHGEDPQWDAIEANTLYELLEKEVIPQFYTRDHNGIPTKFVSRIRESMAQLTPQFSADRAVRQYTEQYYIPAATNYLERAANQGALGKTIVEWQHELRIHWDNLRFGNIKTEQKGNQYAFEVEVYLDDLDPNAVKVELYADGHNKTPIKQEMSRLHELSGNPHMYLYQATVPADRPIQEYTSRIIPYFPHVSIPLGAAQILQIVWQH